jgi:hypothetical protein
MSTLATLMQRSALARTGRKVHTHGQADGGNWIEKEKKFLFLLLVQALVILFSRYLPALSANSEYSRNADNIGKNFLRSLAKSKYSPNANFCLRW